MVECELCISASLRYANAVLIDTWWNVNRKMFNWHTSRELVLIDTWWNVNDVNDGNKLSADSVLIDTWWNVNDFFSFL